MLTLYATDLDGTLLGSDARLEPWDAAIYQRLCDAGVLLTFITARTPATIEPLLVEAKPQVPGVAMTGAAIWDPRHRRYDTIVYHTPSTMLTISEIFKSQGFSPFVYTLPHGTNSLKVFHSSPILSPVEAAFVNDRKLNDLKTFYIGQEAPSWAKDCTVLFFAIGTPEEAQQAADAINASTPCQAAWYPDTYNPGIALLEVFAPGVSKAEGLMRLKQKLGADRVVAFGDNLNDIPMLQAADLGVAVANAHPQVKAAAGLEIGPNTEHSVLRFIAKQEGVEID